MPFKVDKKLFVWMSPSSDAVPARFGARSVDPEEKPLLIESDPDVYFETPHYHGYPIVLVHLAKISPARRSTERDRGRLVAAGAEAAPRRAHPRGLAP